MDPGGHNVDKKKESYKSFKTSVHYTVSGYAAGWKGTIEETNLQANIPIRKKRGDLENLQNRVSDLVSGRIRPTDRMFLSFRF